MRILVYEFVTGGGLAGLFPPAALACEADLMVRSLVADLADLPGVSVFTVRDPRLPPLSGIAQIAPSLDEPPIVTYSRALASADAAWPIAPETLGVLEALARRTLTQGKKLLGCAPAAVRVAASKFVAATVLRDAGVTVVPTFASSADVPDRFGCWVVKPDDGAGSDGALVVPSASAARDALAKDPGRLVAQPWLAGDPMSLSLLCERGRAVLLACNRQRVRIREGRFSLEGIDVNTAFDRLAGHRELANRIAAAIPSLWGYVGVDFLATRDGPVVLEVNPRLTTSYCGLRKALGVNVAELVLSLASGETLSELVPPWCTTTVELDLGTSRE